MNYLPFDDVYFTGILARTIGVNHVYWTQYRNVRLTAGYELTHHEQESIPVGCGPPACWPEGGSFTAPRFTDHSSSFHGTPFTVPSGQNPPGWNPPPQDVTTSLLWTEPPSLHGTPIVDKNITFPQLCLRAVKSPTNCLLVTCTLIIKMFLVINGSYRSQVFLTSMPILSVLVVVASCIQRLNWL